MPGSSDKSSMLSVRGLLRVEAREGSKQPSNEIPVAVDLDSSYACSRQDVEPWVEAWQFAWASLLHGLVGKGEASRAVSKTGTLPEQISTFCLDTTVFRLGSANRRPSVVAPPTTPPGTPRPPRSRAALLAQPPGRQPTAGLRRGPFRAEHTELVAQPGVWSMPGGPMQLPTALLWQWQPGTPQTSTLEVSSCIHDWTIYEGFTNILLIIITDLRHQHRHQHHQVQDAEASSSASSGPGPRAPRTSGALASSRPRPDLLICDAL
ncbi:unnamed protein product [Prorocentrum cordatum]|nr:unnamed protein product [Polarella glacialis]